MTMLAFFMNYDYRPKSAAHVDGIVAREWDDHPHLWFCLFASHDKSKTAVSKIAKLGTGIVHHDTSPTN